MGALSSRCSTCAVTSICGGSTGLWLKKVPEELNRAALSETRYQDRMGADQKITWCLLYPSAPAACEGTRNRARPEPTLLNRMQILLLINGLANVGYRHKRVQHAAKVYVDGDAHTNTLEGFSSLSKERHPWRLSERHSEVVANVTSTSARFGSIDVGIAVPMFHHFM